MKPGGQINNGDFKINDFKMIYAGGDKHEKGVGLMLDADMAKCVLGYWTVSERVLLVKLQGQPFNISVIVVYAPTAESTEEEIDVFYDKLEEVKSQCKSDEIQLIMGDLNAKVGQGQDGKTVGKFGLGDRHERGDRWVQWCEENNMTITSAVMRPNSFRIPGFEPT
ncbi:craniofacial development protein 2-like [Amphiura filiformis]|uniref:craniofacial development protein 2-like n=1 Tax=Amphiura filiformis TaxID=82378 RepID=UPI003B20E61C